MTKTGFTHESTYNESKEWYTPRWIFQRLGLQFNIDPASPGKDVVPWIPAARHITWPYGLKTEWYGRVWLNPPYGSDTPKWICQMATEYLAGMSTGIMLVFARTDTAWFQDYAIHASALCFLRGRIHFVPEKMAKAYAAHQFEPSESCGAGSLLLAYGEEEASALENFHDIALVIRKEDGYQYELPLSRLSEMPRADVDFESVPDSARKQCPRPHENSPCHVEQGQLFKARKCHK